MLIRDRIWGDFKCEEPVIEELLELKELQRLKGISQFGLPYEYYPLPQFTRYEHSVGVMLVLRRVGAGLEEQIAGLLHDISHTAFSHLIDWVIGDRKHENYQDIRHAESVCNSETARVLQKYGFSPQRISDHRLYSLLEQPSPHLCADRIDYAIREFRDWANSAIVPLCIKEMKNHKGKMIFSSRESASAFAYAYLKLQREHWGEAEWMLRWQMFSDMLQSALQQNIISLQDFFYDDAHVINKLKDSTDNKIKQGLELLSGKLQFEIVDREPAQFHLHKKFRYVDPEYLEQGVLYRLSECDTVYRNLLKEERNKNRNGICINLLH